MSNNIYYVYQYYDPIRKEPIYIGKGKGDRNKRHLFSFNLKKKHPFIQRINWIKKQEKEPIVTKLFENISEKQAFKIESKLINEIGRKDLGKGPLLNLTDGGEGACGYKHTNKWKQNISTIFSGEKHPMFGKHHKKETIEKMILNHANVSGKNNPFFGKKHSPQTIKTLSKKYIIIYPNGKKEKIINLKKFCRENHLNNVSLGRVALGKQAQHVGFRCKFA